MYRLKNLHLNKLCAEGKGIFPLSYDWFLKYYKELKRLYGYVT